jgi:asparagine synthase (glutamine-hydrolysing)
MCGIVGCLALALEADPDQGWVQTATERISHRGPDDEGFYTDPDVALGFRRLAIIDLSPGGHQPMRSADGRYWMVYNGEIYNYLELGQELRQQGVALRTSSDSEVLLEMYARVGKDVVHRLRGMFAFAIWDTWTRELFCARDQFGIKPFYYTIDQVPAQAQDWAGGAAPGQQGWPGGATEQPGWPGDPAQQPGWPGGQAQQSAWPPGPAEQAAWPGGAVEQPGWPGGPAEQPAWPGGAAEQPAWPGGPAEQPAWPGGPAGQPGQRSAGPVQQPAWDAPPPSGGWDAPPSGGRHAGGAAARPAAANAPAGRGGGRHAAGRGQQPGGPPSPAPGVAGNGAPGSGLAPGAPGPGGFPGDAQGAARSTGTGLLLRFASERKCLASPGELSRLDGDALRRYLAFQYVPPPDALTPPIRVLPPGHAIIARPGGTADVYRYWRADLRPASAPSQGSAEAILAAMRDSVAVHLRSDAPLGAFLSGGIDSAAICALAAEHRPDLLTFTVGFEREGYSEIDRAQETAAALGVKSIPYVITAEEFFTHLPRIIWHLDDPMADAAAVPLWFVAREASKHVKVVLSGEGSDELFGGYAIYHQPGVVRAGERLPELARMPLKRAASMMPAGVKGKGFLERTSTPLRERYIGNAHVFAGPQIDLVARPPATAASSAYAVTAPVYQQAAEAGLDDTSTMQLVDINTWLPGDILVKADRMTMAHSLELRVPFLDREVMGVASRLARDEKIAVGTTKLALRQAMTSVLPQAAAERAKLGFPVPIGFWLKGEMYGYAERLLREARTDQWIDRQAALGLLERFRAGDPEVSWRHIWVLLVFSLWHQIYVERVYDPAALGWERAPSPGAAW